MDNFPAVAILGPRQVGKTTLAKSLERNLPHESLYLDLENPLDVSALSAPMEFFRSHKHKTVIIDEIQRMPELFPVLRSAIDENRTNGRFLLLGSASSELLWMSNETLAGRLIYTELSPFTVNEIIEIADYRNHWFRGGYPVPFLMADDQLRREWFNSFLLGYVERDLPVLGLGSPPGEVRRILQMLAIRSGNLLNISQISKAMEISVTKLKSIIDYFERSFIVRRLYPWHYNLNKRLIKSPKIYIRDSGQLHHMLNIHSFEDVLRHPNLGYSWEGYIIEQICNNLDKRFDFYFYRTADGAECDLLLTRGMKVMACIEIKFTEYPKLSKGFTQVINDLGTKNNYLIIPNLKVPYRLGINILVTDLLNFLNLEEKLSDEA